MYQTSPTKVRKDKIQKQLITINKVKKDKSKSKIFLQFFKVDNVQDPYKFTLVPHFSKLYLEGLNLPV